MIHKIHFFKIILLSNVQMSICFFLSKTGLNSTKKGWTPWKKSDIEPHRLRSDSIPTPQKEKNNNSLQFNFSSKLFNTTLFTLTARLISINPKELKVFGLKFRLREIKRIFPLKYAILSFGKCLNYWISGFQRDDIFKLWQYWTEKIL